MMVRSFLILFIGAFSALSLLSCQQNSPTAPAPRAVASMALAVDASASGGDGAKTSVVELRCSEVAGLVARQLRESKRVDVLVLAAGGRATAYEPRVIVPWRRFAPTLKQFGEATSKAAQAEAFLSSLVERCRSTLVQEDSSPIVSVVSRAALSLASHCTELTAHREICTSRQLIALSDLRENVNTSVRERLLAVSKALRTGKALPPRPKTFPTMTLDDKLAVCGLSEHIAGKDDLGIAPDAVALVWRELINRDVVFEAACPGLPVSSGYDAKAQGGVR